MTTSSWSFLTVEENVIGIKSRNGMKNLKLSSSLTFCFFDDYQFPSNSRQSTVVFCDSSRRYFRHFLSACLYKKSHSK